MKKILITMASGPLATGIISAFRALDEPFHIIGLDSNPLHIHGADVDKRILVPRIKAPEFFPMIRAIIAEEKPDFFWPLHDDEMPLFAEMKDLGVPMFLPDPETFRLTQDKMSATEHYKRHGVPVPDTIFINNRPDLEQAFSKFGGEIWLRANVGAGSKGAFRARNIDDAIRWLDLNKGWGEFTAAEVITGADCVVETVWNHGELMFAQSRTRPDGTPGEIGAGSKSRSTLITGAPPAVFEVGVKAIKSVAERPHGIMFVDQKIDSVGVPRVTEINTGRFSGGGMATFHSQGFNVAELVLKLGLGEDPGFTPPVINPIPAGVYKLSGSGFPTLFIREEEIEPLKMELAQRMKRFKEKSA